MVWIMRKLFIALPLILSASPFAGCAESTSASGDDAAQIADLTASQRLARETAIRDVAASFGLRNGALLAGIAEAEVFLQHCWSEATWTCQGPYSAECGGPVAAGVSDGPCPLRQGGLGMFQFDRGTHDDTIAGHGEKILNVAGSVEEAVTFVVNMAINSAYTPTYVSDRPSALAWLNEVRIDGPTYDTWLKTVVHYYNGCAPGQCPTYQQRRQKYDGALRTVWNERGGATFWQAASAGRTWSTPLTGRAWWVDFDVVNPSVPGFGGCFNKPLNQLVHAGEDWGTAAGTPVRAVGEGTVVYADNANYPGWVVVVRHDLTPSERTALGLSTSTIFSQYGHLSNVSVQAGQQVTAGQQLASVYNWGSNSHLHWEVRTAETPDLCSRTKPGPGYTDAATHPQNWGYLDPESSVLALQSAGGASTCDNNVPINGTACSAQGEAVEYVCKRPGQPSNQQWDARACPPGLLCQGDHCAPTCDNNVPVNGTACAAQGQPVEYVCKRPGQPSNQQWDVRSCSAGSNCQGDRCQTAACSAQTSAAACDAQGGACAWYGCANRCEPKGTNVNQVCPNFCATHGTRATCDTYGWACAWYACANACRPVGTPIEQVCPLGSLATRPRPHRQTLAFGGGELRRRNLPSRWV